MGRNLPKLTKATADATATGTDSNVNTTASGGFDPTAATVSYITSSLPTAANPNNMQTMTEAELNNQFINMTPQERIAYANQLKAAGYSVGPITGAPTVKLRKAWIDAHSALDTEIKQTQQQLDLPTFLAINAGTGTGGAKTITQQSEISDTAAKALINSLFQDLTGFKATEKQIADYTQKLRTAQAANPLKVTYSGSGSSVTKGGIDTQEFLKGQIEQTDAAVTNRATDAYTMMMQELGGLR